MMRATRSRARHAVSEAARPYDRRMPPSHRDLTGIAAALALVATLAACSGSTDLPVPDLLETTPVESPLDAAYDRIYGSLELSPEDLARRDVADWTTVQDAIATCMAEAGFTYVPYVPESLSSPPAPLPDEPDSSPLERAHLEGYGVVHAAVTEPAAPGSPLPNVAIRDALSDAERAEYDAALDGFVRDENDEQVFDENSELVRIEGVGPTCQDRAHEHAAAVKAEEIAAGTRPDLVNPLQADPAWTEFTTAAGELPERVAADERVADLDGEWSQCLAEAGYPDLDDPFDAYSLAVEAWETWADEHTADDGTVPLEDPEVARLQSAEVALAVQDYTCQEDLGYGERRQAVTFAYEQQLVDAWAEDIERFEQVWATSREG